MKTRTRSPYGGSASEKLAFYSSPQEEETGCVLWTGHEDDSGYGVIWFEGRLWKANRLALTVKLGRPIKNGLKSCHTCHRPSCINPDHLYEGTQRDNMRDMREAGRKVVVSGDAHPNAKLTIEQIEAIRIDTRKRRYILAEYDIGPSHYHRIKRGVARSDSS